MIEKDPQLAIQQKLIEITQELQSNSRKISVNKSQGTLDMMVDVNVIDSEDGSYKGYCLDHVIDYGPYPHNDPVFYFAARIKKNIGSGIPYFAKNEDGEKEYKWYMDLYTQKAEFDRQKHAIEYLNYCKFPKKFYNSTIESYKELSETHKKLKDYAENYCDEFALDSKGIYLAGGVGIGKTHIVCGIANRLIKEKLIRVSYQTTPELLEKLKATFDGKEQREYENIMNKCKKADLLILDDIGVEKVSDRSCEVLYLIVNYRYERMMPTIFTSNCLVQELSARIGGRVPDRIYEMCKVIDLSRIKESYRGKE